MKMHLIKKKSLLTTKLVAHKLGVLFQLCYYSHGGLLKNWGNHDLWVHALGIEKLIVIHVF